MNSETRSLCQTFETDDPVAVVTGAGAARVGRVIAEELSRRGAHVVLHANRSGKEAEEVASQWPSRFEREAVVVTGDLTHDEVCENLIDQAVSRFGRLDVLINSAAIWSPTSIDAITGDEIRRYFQINSVAPLLCSRAAGRVMVQQSAGGCIINLGDWATVRPYADHAAYFPSKAAIEVMTRSLAVELGSRHQRVRVNCVQPGPVLMGDDVPKSTIEQLEQSTLAKRIGTPKDVAHAVAMLCENTFITGVCLPVDGGRQIFAPDGLQVGKNTG
ncbi:MAG: SDR family oxidoreductase [Planctomycetota bacterium]